MNQTISVIIPVYNRGWEFKRALDSLVSQSDKDFEVIVCDDGSQEDIKKILYPYLKQLRLSYIRIDNSGGPAHPRNVAATYASGKWLSFLDSDDWWYQSRIKDVKSLLSEDIDLLYHSLRVIFLKKSKLSCFKKNKVGVKIQGDPLKYMLLNGNLIPCSAAIIRKSVFLKINGFDENKKLVSVEDFDLWLRLARNKGRFRFLKKILGYYWVGNNSIRETPQDQILKYKEIFSKHKIHVPPEILANFLATNLLTIASMKYKIGKGKRSTIRKLLLAAHPLPSLRLRLKRFVYLILCYLPV
jgi:glycosyltransferase involved in cell wall biosynthesis